MNKKDIKNPEILQVLKVDKMEGIHLFFDRYYISLVVFAEQYTSGNQFVGSGNSG